MRSIGVLLVISLIICGCATNPATPSTVDEEAVTDLRVSNTNSQTGNHRLWGEWEIHIDATHTHAEAIPIRSGRFHLNTLKFLEETCTDCLQILGIHKNGDGTTDLMVRLTHPFPGLPQFTGFDVKGIIMFEGSYDVPFAYAVWPFGERQDPSYFHISAGFAGDPEVLNPDGYSVLWSPWWPSGSDMEIFNYRQGKYSNGTPTANINAFLNFYTDEERHMFRNDGSVVRIYNIWLPPGPVVAGYAVDACWEPPDVTPVTDPLNDFPVSANQSEPYHFRFVLNNDEVIKEDCCLGSDWLDCSRCRYEYADWYGESPRHGAVALPYWYNSWTDQWAMCTSSNMEYCMQSPPESYQWLFGSGTEALITGRFGDGEYRGVAVIGYNDWQHGTGFTQVAYTVFPFTIDLE